MFYFRQLALFLTFVRICVGGGVGGERHARSSTKGRPRPRRSSPFVSKYLDYEKQKEGGGGGGSAKVSLANFSKKRICICGGGVGGPAAVRLRYLYESLKFRRSPLKFVCVFNKARVLLCGDYPSEFYNARVDCVELRLSMGNALIHLY